MKLPPLVEFYAPVLAALVEDVAHVKEPRDIVRVLGRFGDNYNRAITRALNERDFFRGEVETMRDELLDLHRRAGKTNLIEDAQHVDLKRLVDDLLDVYKAPELRQAVARELVIKVACEVSGRELPNTQTEAVEAILQALGCKVKRASAEQPHTHAEG